MGISPKKPGQVVIGLDLSTKPGYAILADGERLASGTSRPPSPLSSMKGEYPFTYVGFTQSVVENLLYKVMTHIQFSKLQNSDVDVIVIEETTASSQNYSQKILEFIHYEFLKTVTAIFPEAKVVYIRDLVWKKANDAHMNAEEKKNNLKLSRLKKKKAEENPNLKKIIVKKDTDGTPIKKVSRQDAYIRKANEIFSLDLKLENEDEAAALLLARAYITGVPHCNGRLDGGVYVKKPDGI